MDEPVIHQAVTADQPEVEKTAFRQKLKNLTKKQKILLAAGSLLAFVLLIGVIWLIPQKVTNSKQVVIAKVGDVELTENYLDNELKYYPATPSAEAKKAITQKIIDDQITLAAAKADGLISDYPVSPNLSPDEYLKRTEVVQDVKKKIDAQGNVVTGKTVMVWFYNNQHIGPGGLQASKKTAYAKIKPLYDKVKSGEITIDQAGEVIKSDQTIAEIDPAWQSNALAPFRYYKDQAASFWPEFNDLIWKTEPGQLTPLYLGGGILKDGKPTEELYIFSQVETKSSSSYNNYSQWLEQKKNKYPVSLSLRKAIFNLFETKPVLADDNLNNGSRSALWYGTITTMTGLPLPGAVVNILNGCNSPRGRTQVTDANGKYNTGVDYNLSCLCNPQTFTVTYNGELCRQSGGISLPKSGIGVPNGDVTFEQNAVCGPPPPPPPPPACNVACSSNSFCSQATDGCTSCISGSCQKCESKPAEARTLACPPGDTGSITETRTYACPAGTWSEWTTTSNSCTPPPACGDSCTTDSYCFGAPDGCTSCVPNNSGTGSICSKPQVCGSSCVRDDQCIGDAAKDGCTACISGSCQKPPACNVSCTSDTYCGEAKDGCTECAPNLSGQNVCQTPFSEAMCKCDGFNAINIQNPSAGEFKFEAFGKVEGNDVSRAKIDTMTFTLYKSSKNNPDQNVTKVATSQPITPTIVSSDNGKVRYRAEWSVKPPSYDPNAVYRVGATPKCVKKTGPLSEAFDFDGKIYSSDNTQVLGSELNYSPVKLVQNDYLELGTLKDGYYTRMMDTDSCSFLRFEYGQY